MTRHEKIDLIYYYHTRLGNQSWLEFYIDNCKTGVSLDTISDDELYKIIAYMEDDYADL